MWKLSTDLLVAVVKLEHDLTRVRLLPLLASRLLPLRLLRIAVVDNFVAATVAGLLCLVHAEGRMAMTERLLYPVCNLSAQILRLPLLFCLFDSELTRVEEQIVDLETEERV